ncbi:holin [Pseudomonas aeruginosa]|nr:holin [Pseudomonas aeruginosa]KXC67736.1 holin [Pseudomonas aeruginosa]KXC69170.1 holin [Pseudomonas aeruginosa]
MGNEPQTLTEMPLWVLILLAALGGVSGEMWRADKAGLGGWALLRRLALRSGASIVCGVAVMLLALACGAALLFAAALGSLTAAAGAEIAVGL